MITAAAIVGLSFALSGVQPASPCQGNSFVAVNVGAEGFVITTPARPTAAGRWRFRTVRVRQPSGPVPTVRIDAAGGHAWLDYQGRQQLRIDLRRQIPEFDARRDGESIADGKLQPVECRPVAGALASLDEEFARHLRNESLALEERSNWLFFAVQVRAETYAPILQFGPYEIAWPSRFEIWNDLEKEFPADVARIRDSAGNRRERLLELYQVYKSRSELKPAVYWQVQDLPGSWLIQYWLYYPFDTGHLHDSEHVFVEVDKLGGTVRRIVGAGHGPWAPNNQFHTFASNAIPVGLPLYTIVEQGKHATAPDVDTNGVFTPGIDTNYYREATKQWGVRDTVGVTDSNLKSFASSMMVQRRVNDSYAPEWTAESGIERPEGISKTYELIPIPTGTVVASTCNDTTPQCAASQVLRHDDFRNSQSILKPAIYPRFAVRLSYSALPTADEDLVASTQRSFRYILGGSVELAEIPVWKGRRIPLPGRLGADVILDEPLKYDGFSLRYEWMASNLFGFYAGASRITDDLKDLPEKPPEASSRSVWLSAGTLYEMPMPGTRTFLAQTQAGFLFSNFWGLSWDVRLGLAWTFGAKHTEFGIASRTPNPY